jgi:hypothetical protein
LEIIWRRPTCQRPLPPLGPTYQGTEAAWPPCAATLPLAVATRARTCVKDRPGLQSGATQRSEAVCATTSASLCCSCPADSHRSVSRIAPLPVTEAITELVCSLIAPLPHLHREPFHRAECSAVVLLPSCHRRLSVRATVTHLVLVPLHAGSAAPTLEAKPCHPSPVARPPRLCHCRSSSGVPCAMAAVLRPTPPTRPYPVYSPRADHRREHCRGHPRRWIAPAIPRPN